MDRQKENRDSAVRGQDLIAGRNAVSEALKSGRTIDSLYVQRGEKSGPLLSLIARAKEQGIPSTEADPRKLEHLTGGAVEYLPVVRVQNLVSLLEDLKRRGVWVYAADMDGSPWCETDFSGPVALVIGSEGRGVGRLIKEKSDFVVSLPIKGHINSLNASVAAGVLCYEVCRQRAGLTAVNR